MLFKIYCKCLENSTLATVIKPLKSLNKSKFFVNVIPLINNINSIDDIASTIGIGSLEMAIALCTANPFLLIGGVLSLTSGLKGLINTGSVVYFKNVNRHLSLEFSTNTLNIKNYVDMYKIENNTDYSIDGQISKYSF